jgi:erythromycin esterase-like protein
MIEDTIVTHIRKNAVRLNSPENLDFLIDAIGDKRFVLLGEASHGTSEFYTLRMELSRQLIEKKGFSFISVEGDWPSCYEVNRYIKHYDGAKSDIREVMASFNRWPTWMWANEETMKLAEWLKSYNLKKPVQERIGFYGLDMYSLWESMEEILHYLKRNGSNQELEIARRAFECFEPYGKEGQSYGVSAAFLGEGCQDEVVKLLKELQSKHAKYDQDNEATLSAELNALVAVNAERYYRTMVKHDAESWNIRDRHMVEALHRLATFHGPDAKIIVWEHNTHIGDARETDMAADGMVNVGQLLRESYGEDDVFAIGFGTYSGTVIAAESWGAPIKTMQVPPGRRGSWEELMHRAGAHDQILLLDREDPLLGHEMLGHRAIGVVYHPAYERGNYVPSVIARRYDAFVHVDESHALHPLAIEKVSVQ